MNRNSTHIQSANKRFYGAVGDGLVINPISKVDTNIINELIELFKKLDVPEITQVFDYYKLNPDEDIYEALMGINTEMGGEMLEDMENPMNGDKKLPFWIHFKDIGRNRIIRPNIVNFAPLDAVGDDAEQYGIILNKTPDNVKQVPFHANEVLLYDDEEVREKDMNQLEKLSKY